MQHAVSRKRSDNDVIVLPAQKHKKISALHSDSLEENKTDQISSCHSAKNIFL